MRHHLLAIIIACATLTCGGAFMPDADAAPRSDDLALLGTLEITLADLKSPSLDTPVVAGGQPVATICHADDPAWQQAAVAVQAARGRDDRWLGLCHGYGPIVGDQLAGVPFDRERVNDGLGWALP